MDETVRRKPTPDDARQRYLFTHYFRLVRLARNATFMAINVIHVHCVWSPNVPGENPNVPVLGENCNLPTLFEILSNLFS